MWTISCVKAQKKGKKCSTVTLVQCYAFLTSFNVYIYSFGTLLYFFSEAGVLVWQRERSAARIPSETRALRPSRRKGVRTVFSSMGVASRALQSVVE